jgi:hypothetical protein
MNNEQERLRRLRDRQLAARDPQVKQRQIQRNVTRKERQARGRHESLRELWETLPQTVRCPLIGFVVGVAVIFILPYVWDSKFAIWAGVIATVLFAVFGAILGHSLDLRDDLRDFMKH